MCVGKRMYGSLLSCKLSSRGSFSFTDNHSCRVGHERALDRKIARPPQIAPTKLATQWISAVIRFIYPVKNVQEPCKPARKPYATNGDDGAAANYGSHAPEVSVPPRNRSGARSLMA